MSDFLNLLVIFAFCLVPAFIVAFLTWKIALRSRPLRLPGRALVFAVSAASSVIVYGHAGPIPLLIVMISFEDIRTSPEALGTDVLWMLATGLVTTGVFTYWSNRRARHLKTE